MNRSIFIALLLSASVASNAFAALKNPSTYNHSDYSCPLVSAIQKHVWTLKPGQTSTWSDSEALKWTVDVPTDATNPPHLYGYQGALWDDKTKQVICRYGNLHTNGVTTATGQFKVVQPDSIPWEVIDLKRETIQHLKYIHEGKEWEAINKHDMICEGSRPDLCVFAIMNRSS